MTVHDLKVWPEPFAALRDGRKRFDVRWERERRYSVGDVLRLREWDPTTTVKHHCDRKGCNEPVVHREHWYSSYRSWCAQHVPMSGHYEKCPDPCVKLVGFRGYTGAEVQRRVTYVLRGPAWEDAVPKGVVVLSLSETL